MSRPTAASSFIRPIHPKTEIKPQTDAIARILKLGWVGQMKIHGHRAQIHIHADEQIAPLVYNRQGQLHKKDFPAHLATELRRLFPLKEGWTVVDCEWLKSTDHLYLFDLLKLNDTLLNQLNYAERYEMLPQVYSSPDIETLPLYKTVQKCLDVIGQAEAQTSERVVIEGLVFRSLKTKGFADTSIVRCRVHGRH